MSYRQMGATPPQGDPVTAWALEQARRGCETKAGDFDESTLSCTCPYGYAADGSNRCLTVGEAAFAPEVQRKDRCEAAGGVYING